MQINNIPEANAKCSPALVGLSSIIIVASLLVLSACDFSVTNPGPIHDTFLDDPGAREAVVNGVGRDFADALNWIGYRSAAVAREIHPAGATGSYGITVRSQRGEIAPDEHNTYWNNAQRARWTGDHAVDRLEASMESSEFNDSELVAQAYLWQGYAYRLLGENMCEAVIDGSAVLGDNTIYLEEAEEAFTSAQRIAENAGAQETATAAIAARASVYMNLDNWSNAAADAEEVLNRAGRAFDYSIPYSDIEQDQYNRIYEAAADNPYRAHTVWQTYYEEYYQEYKDPRTPWSYELDADGNYRVGDATVGELGHVPWFFQLKYDNPEAPITLSSGSEMELIRAEHMLRQGQWEQAMNIVNDLRADVGVEPWEASSLDEAWEMLIRERGIVLWLEARRLNDLRRWIEDSAVPDRFSDLEWDGGDHPMLPLPERDLCFPIPDSELETNPNL